MRPRSDHDEAYEPGQGSASTISVHKVSAPDRNVRATTWKTRGMDDIAAPAAPGCAGRHHTREATGADTFAPVVKVPGNGKLRGASYRIAE